MSNQNATLRDVSDSDGIMNVIGSLRRCEFLRRYPRDVRYWLSIAENAIRRAAILQAQYEAWGDGP